MRNASMDLHRASSATNPISVLMTSTSRITVASVHWPASNGCGSGQQPHHGALELLGENGDGRPFCVRQEGVRPMTLEPQCSFLLGEAGSAAHFLLRSTVSAGSA